MATNIKPKFSTKLFALYKLQNGNPCFQQLKHDKDKCKEGVLYYHPKDVKDVEGIDEKRNSIDSPNMLHPQAEKFLSDQKKFQLNNSLKDFFQRATWQTKISDWAKEILKPTYVEIITFKITDINAILFPSNIFALYVDIEPEFEITDQNAATVGKLLLNRLSRTDKYGKNRPKINVVKDLPEKEKFLSSTYLNCFTVFKKLEQGDEGSKEESIKGKEISVEELINGEEISMEELINSFVPKNVVSKDAALHADRFLTYSFIKTSIKENDIFSEVDYRDLIRLSRAESDHYLPNYKEENPEENGIINTYENIAFSLSGEGTACWVKPKESQDFLEDKFKQQYNTIYLQMYLLALHQRYALVNLSIELGKKIGNSREENARNVEEIKELRHDVANFYLWAYYQQPAVKTRHQKFYSVLHKVLGNDALLNEVQKSTTEYDHIVVQREQEKEADLHLILSLILETIAIPYYTFGLYKYIKYSFDIKSNWGWLTAFIALYLLVASWGFTIKFFMFDKQNLLLRIFRKVDRIIKRQNGKTR